ncbi:hypothetical protein IWX90DRAFT_416364 [Phyllosticta citrichinensis]|uniref:Uncharacterized protein n=1 Tax=Phyllosticta citrichinensis TaxID=1130410 RepID=A0ABR1XMJ9_9PEZI
MSPSTTIKTMEDANATIKNTLAKFEAGVHSSLRVREILLDASYIVQTNKKLGSPRKLTHASLINSWITQSSANLSTVKKAWDDLNRRRPCCLQAERCIGIDDPKTVKARKFRHMHDECASLAYYWVEKITPMTMRNANLEVALAIANERQLDLSAFRKQALRAFKAKTAEAFRPSSSLHKAASETNATASRCASPELPPPLLPPAKDKDKPAKTVTFARSVNLLGQEATRRPTRTFNRCKPDTYVPGRWAPPNRKPRLDAAAEPNCAPTRKLSKRARVSTKCPDSLGAAATAYPLEPFNPDGPPSFFNTYGDYDYRTFDFASNSTPHSSPCPSPPPPLSPDSEPEPEPEPQPDLPHDDMFLDTSGVSVPPSAFYHDDPLLDAEEWALEAERRAVWDAFLSPVPVPKRGLLERVRGRCLTF